MHIITSSFGWFVVHESDETFMRFTVSENLLHTFIEFHVWIFASWVQPSKYSPTILRTKATSGNCDVSICWCWFSLHYQCRVFKTPNIGMKSKAPKDSSPVSLDIDGNQYPGIAARQIGFHLVVFFLSINLSQIPMKKSTRKNRFKRSSAGVLLVSLATTSMS